GAGFPPRGAKYFPFPKHRHIAGQASERGTDNRRSRLTVAPDKTSQQSHHDQIVSTAVDERWRQKRPRSPQHDRASSHKIAGHRPCATPYDQRSGEHPAAGMTSRVSLNNDTAAPHSITRAIAGGAANHDHAAAH